MPVDGGRQYEALVIVGVLADDIDASGRDRHGARRITKRLPESGSRAFIELMRRAHDERLIRAKSQSASVAFSAIGNSGSVRSCRSKRQVLMPIVGRRLRSARAISDSVPR